MPASSPDSLRLTGRPFCTAEDAIRNLALFGFLEEVDTRCVSQRGRCAQALRSIEERRQKGTAASAGEQGNAASGTGQSFSGQVGMTGDRRKSAPGFAVIRKVFWTPWFCLRTQLRHRLSLACSCVQAAPSIRHTGKPHQANAASLIVNLPGRQIHHRQNAAKWKGIRRRSTRRHPPCRDRSGCRSPR